MSVLRSMVRIEQSCSELTSLDNEIDNWFKERDFGIQYQTQITTLQDILDQSFQSLSIELGNVKPVDDSGTVYRLCRAADRRLVWVRRVWEYFASRFDQRRDLRYERILKAADEVVWACYAEALRKVEGTDRLKKPVPLPYIEPQYSPRAFTRYDLPLEVQANLLTQERLDSLQKLLSQMPIPVVGLPPTCTAAPWSLAYIAHETGHHVLVDLKNEGKLLRDFSNWLYDASLDSDQAAGQSRDEAAATQWFNWGDEVFADLFSVCCLGPAAAWSMAELENTDETGMLTPLDRYPAPAVRLWLLASAVQALGVKDALVLGELMPKQLAQGNPILSNGIDLRLAAQAHQRRAESIAKKVLTEDLPGLAVKLSIPRLAGFKADKFDIRKGRLGAWINYFFKGAVLTPEANLLETRLATGGGALAWRATQDLPEDKRQKNILNLQAEIPKALVENHETSVRSADEPAKTEVAMHSAALADWLLDPRWNEIYQ